MAVIQGWYSGSTGRQCSEEVKLALPTKKSSLVTVLASVYTSSSVLRLPLFILFNLALFSLKNHIDKKGEISQRKLS